MEAMSKFKPRERGVPVDKSGIGGGRQLGCLSLIICHIESLLGVLNNPDDQKNCRTPMLQL